MITVIQAASYIFHRYKEDYGSDIDEMKLHKLLYLSQRESIIMTGEPMFDAPFEAWKYGPVVVEIREKFRKNALNEQMDKDSLSVYQPVFDSVFQRYAVKDSWNLSLLTHGDSSWQNARQGLNPDEHCSERLSMDDIRWDAERIKIRRYILS